MPHLVEHDFVGSAGIDGVAVTEEDLQEFGAGEVVVLNLRVGGFVFSHAFVAFEDDARVFRDKDLLVTKLTEEASVTTVDSSGYRTEVGDGVVERVTIDMVNLITLVNWTDEGEVLDVCEVLTSALSVEFKITRRRFHVPF